MYPSLVARSRLKAGTTMLAASLLAGLVAGCSGSDDEKRRSAGRGGVDVTVVEGAGKLPAAARETLERDIAALLSEYVQQAFLGDYPRDDFSKAFVTFTEGAAKNAASDVDLLTASRVADSKSVSATRLTAEVSALAPDKEAVGATAHLSFEFRADLGDNQAQQFSMSGRLMLVGSRGGWKVFGYDIARDDAKPVGVGR